MTETNFTSSRRDKIDLSKIKTQKDNSMCLNDTYNFKESIIKTRVDDYNDWTEQIVLQDTHIVYSPIVDHFREKLITKRSWLKHSYVELDPLLSARRSKSRFNEDLFESYNLVVKDSMYILDLKEGWDEDSAKIISKEIYELSTKLILQYMTAIFNEKNHIISNPKIHPEPDGSVDFEWSTRKARLLINFRYDKDVVKGFFYGDLYDNNLAIKGNVPTDNVYDHLMKWMQNL